MLIPETKCINSLHHDVRLQQQVYICCSLLHRSVCGIDKHISERLFIFCTCSLSMTSCMLEQFGDEGHTSTINCYPKHAQDTWLGRRGYALKDECRGVHRSIAGLELQHVADLSCG